MEFLDDFLLPYVDAQSALSLRTCSTLKLCDKKVRVIQIERWWSDLKKKKWTKNVHLLCGIPFKRQNLKCKICKRRQITDAVYMNHKLLFSCAACYGSIEADVIHEVYPQIYSPLHAAFVLFVERGRVEFEHMPTELVLEDLQEFGHENCRTQ